MRPPSRGCRVDGPAGAVATGPAECGAVHLRLSGEDEPDLQPPGSYRAAVLKIAGQVWIGKGLMIQLIY